MTSCKSKIIEEIDSIPENMLPRFYRIFQMLKSELCQNEKITETGVSLKGIWKDSKIDDALFEEAKKSLFPYDYSKSAL